MHPLHLTSLCLLAWFLMSLPFLVAGVRPWQAFAYGLAVPVVVVALWAFAVLVLACGPPR